MKNRLTPQPGKYVWVTIPASYYFEMHGAPHDPEMDKFSFRVGGRVVGAGPSESLVVDIDAYEDAKGNRARLSPPLREKMIPRDKIGGIDSVSYLGDDDPYAPFRFRGGDEVAVMKEDGTPDPDMHGVITGGMVEYQEGGGSYKDEYEVGRPDGTSFRARSLDLVKREPTFANLREAGQIIRDWIRPRRGGGDTHGGMGR